ncbi:MAG: pyridoxine 5'-phosphate synthase [Deltaproteobacteria bacterium]|nr:pyridoxine 5'-phosphate synthase [Deltaproteobacteria bacterium]
MTKFSVNLNKFALLRNSRGHNNPDVLAIAQRCVTRGVHGLTVHPRPDERHTRFADVAALAAFVKTQSGVEFNVEGYPTPAFLELVLTTKPDQCTLVPDEPGQLTSDHGWDAVAKAEQIKDAVRTLQRGGVRVSVFLDPVLAQVEAVKATGTDRIELYTEPYARAFGQRGQAAELARFAAAAKHAMALGIGVNAGHDLNQANLGSFLDAVPGVLEVSIGHAVVCESFDHGLEATLDAYLAIVNARA